jgi:hypothetical protein
MSQLSIILFEYCQAINVLKILALLKDELSKSN